MWTKDGGELPDLDRMIVEGRELTFTSLNKTDNGTYRCEASNHLGTSSAEYVLYVYGEFGGKVAMWEIMYPHRTKLYCKTTVIITPDLHTVSVLRVISGTISQGE